MEPFSYSTSRPILAMDWRRRFLIAVPLIGACHFIGSLGLLARCWIFWDDDPDLAFERFTYAYEFPMFFIGNHYGFPMIANLQAFIFGAIVSAAFWVVFILSIWYAFSAVTQQLKRRRKN